MANYEDNPNECGRNCATHFVMPGVLAILLAFFALFIAPFAANDTVISKEANAASVVERD
jgi:hypothetical protein